MSCLKSEKINYFCAKTARFLKKNAGMNYFLLPTWLQSDSADTRYGDVAIDSPTVLAIYKKIMELDGRFELIDAALCC